MDRESSKVFAWVALAGFLLSIIAHLSTFFGFNPQEHFSAVWLLHIGVFVAFIPVIVLQKKRQKEGKDQFDAFFGLFKHLTAWMKAFCIMFFIYTVVNFISTLIILEGGAPDVRDDRYILNNHGEVIRELSAEEYDRFKSYEVRLGSGHWMFFYFISYTMLYSYSKEIEGNKN